MDNGITISRDGAQYGPYTMVQVTEYLAAGGLLPTDQAWSAQAGAWIPLGQMMAAKSIPAAMPPPPPPKRERNIAVLVLMGFVWWVVFMIVPFIVLCMCAGAIAGALHPENQHEAGAQAGRVVGGITAVPLLFGSLGLSIWLTIAGKLPGTRK